MRTVRQRDLTVFHVHVLFDHFGVHVIELVAGRKGRVDDTGHLRSVFADEIGCVGYVQTLLQHEVRALEIREVVVDLREPSVVAVEFVAEPGVDAREPVVRLRDVDVQQRVVDAFGEETVAALFDHARVTGVRIAGAGVRFGRDFRLAVDMAAGRSGAVFDVAQFAFAPELAADLVGLAAVHQEFAGEAPVTVVFEPGMQPVLMADVAQAAHVIISDLVGDHPAHVPQETVGGLFAAHYDAVVYRQVGGRVVTVAGLELFDHAVREVLSAGFVAVLHHDFERLAVFGRDAA